MKASSLLNAFMIAMLCNGCVNHISEEEEEKKDSEKEIVIFKTSISVSQSPMRSISDNISKILVLDYENGIETQKIEQTSSDANFGKVSMPLKYGTHDLLFVGHNSESSTISYPTISFEKPTDTFSFYLSLKVDEETPPTKNITLDRSVGLIKIVANDAIPSNIKSLKISMSAYYSELNVKTSFANGVPKAIERTFEYKTSNIGAKGSTYSIYSFVPDAEFVSNITISSIGTNGEIVNTITVEKVPIDKDTQTIISGNLFQIESETNLSIKTEWKENIQIPI